MKQIVCILTIWMMTIGCVQKERSPLWLLALFNGGDRRAHIEPANTSITYTGNDTAALVFTLYVDGRNVTGDAQFSLSKPAAGSFIGSQLTIHGTVAGPIKVQATAAGQTAEADLMVFVDTVELLPGAPSNSKDLFEHASGSGMQSITIEHPEDGTLIPNNVNGLDIHWKDSQAGQLFEASLSNGFVRLRKYIWQASGQDSWFALDATSTGLLAGSGSLISMQIRGLDGQSVNRSLPLQLNTAGSDWNGRILVDSYANPVPSVLSRDLSNTTTSFSTFYRDPQPSGRCIACHAASSDGKRLAFTYDQGLGNGGLFDTDTMVTLPDNAARRWSYASFAPDSDRLTTASNGILTLRNFSDGASIADLPTGMLTSQPTFSKDGALISFVARSNGNDVNFTDGKIGLAKIDLLKGELSNVLTLVDGNGNNFSPSFSPDGKWLLFVRVPDSTSNYVNVKSVL